MSSNTHAGFISGNRGPSRQLSRLAQHNPKLAGVVGSNGSGLPRGVIRRDGGAPGEGKVGTSVVAKQPLPWFQKTHFRCASVARDFEIDSDTGKKVMTKYTYSPYFLTGYNTSVPAGIGSKGVVLPVPLVDYYPRLPDPVWQAAGTEYHSKTGIFGAYVKKFAGLWPFLVGQHGQMLCGDLVNSKYLDGCLVTHEAWLKKYLDTSDEADAIEARVARNTRSEYKPTGAAAAYAKNAREVAHLAEIQDRLLVSRLRDMADEKRAKWTLAQVELDGHLRPHRKWSPTNPRFVAVPYEVVGASAATAASVAADDLDEEPVALGGTNHGTGHGADREPAVEDLSENDD